MTYLDIDEKALKEVNAIYTAKEIAGQPNLWINIYNKIFAERFEIKGFLDSAFQSVEKIILAGAGTSAFIGHSLEGIIQRKQEVTTVSISTTHLVSHPQDYFEMKVPTLLVSFARSGNSPESVAAVNLANKYCNACFHLIITCNADGDLATQTTRDNTFVFVLPEEANDKSLAMTGSYSGMLLSALLMNDINEIGNLKDTVKKLFKYGNSLLTENLESIRSIAKLPFDRTVFLGSGPQYGTALESHLKLQELSDGQVICKNDSYLGFRHGPKAVVNEKTLLVYYFSNKKEVFRYEKDLVESMHEGTKPLYEIGISETNMHNLHLNKTIVLTVEKETIEESYLCVCTILVGQMLGFFKSIELGLSPDSPSTSGAISRVVKGVTIY